MRLNDIKLKPRLITLFLLAGIIPLALVGWWSGQLAGAALMAQSSFANLDTGKVDTEAASEALSGKTDAKVLLDYNGNPVLSAFAPIGVGDVSWAFLAEIYEAEVMGPINKLRMTVAVVGLVIAVLVALAALFIAQQIAGPMIKGVAFAKEVARWRMGI